MEPRIVDTPRGRVLVFEAEGSDGGGPILHEMPLEAIATRSDRWGMNDAMEIVEALIHALLYGDTTVDPDTGENISTETFQVLAHVETAREEEYLKAQKEGRAQDPRSPLLRSAMVARREAELLSKCQETARRRADLAEPSLSPSVMRNGGMTCGNGKRRGELCEEVWPAVKKCLEPYTEEIGRIRAAFRHAVTDRPEDPFAEPEEPEPAPEVTLDDIKSRYASEEQR